MIPDEAVEAAALATYGVDDGGLWADECPEVKAYYLGAARAALEAAAPRLTERAYNAGHLDGMAGAPNSNPYRAAK